MPICRICKADAVVSLRYANLSLCREHFIQYLEKRVLTTIERYRMVRRGDLIAIAVSGGKDSVALLHLMNKIRDRLQVDLLGITIDLGIKEYSETSVEIAVENFKEESIDYRIVKLSDYGFTIDDLARTRRRVCSYCGTVKRYILNAVARREGANAIATGHNLDDITAVLLQAYIRGDVDTLRRLDPALPGGEGFVARIKPLIEVSEKETMTYAFLEGLKWLSDECPYSRGATSLEYKSIMNILEYNHPSIKLQMLRVFLKRIKPLLGHQTGGKVKNCKICGEPAMRDVCSFCRLRLKVVRE